MGTILKVSFAANSEIVVEPLSKFSKFTRIHWFLANDEDGENLQCLEQFLPLAIHVVSENELCLKMYCDVQMCNVCTCIVVMFKCAMFKNVL